MGPHSASTDEDDAERTRAEGECDATISEFETGKTTMRLDTLYRVFQILKLRLAAVDLKVPEEPEEEEEW